MPYAVAQEHARVGLRIEVGAARADLEQMVLLGGIRLSVAGIMVSSALR
jgi:hypothetical protein